MKCIHCGHNRFYERRVYNLQLTGTVGYDTKTGLMEPPKPIKGDVDIRTNIVVYHVCNSCHKPHFMTDWTKEERDEG